MYNVTFLWTTVYIKDTAIYLLFYTVSQENRATFIFTVILVSIGQF